MKRHTVILPFRLPRLTDKAAAQFIALLHELIGAIEQHYATQVHRYHKRQQKNHQEIRYHQLSAINMFEVLICTLVEGLRVGFDDVAQDRRSGAVVRVVI